MEKPINERIIDMNGIHPHPHFRGWLVLLPVALVMLACVGLGGDSVGTAEVIAAIEKAEPSARGKISFDDVPLPFPPEVDNTALKAAIGPLKFTPLKKGVAETLTLFRRALAEGKIRAE